MFILPTGTGTTDEEVKEEEPTEKKKKPRRRKRAAKEEIRSWALLVLALVLTQLGPAGTSSPGSTSGGGGGGQKYSVRQVHTRYGTLRGIVSRIAGSGAGASETSVEVYLGVPYATPPLGALRFMPPVTPSPWRGTRVADAFAPVCPQIVPKPRDDVPLRHRLYIDRVAPLLANQSEDCLYLNIYVPRPASQNQPSTGSSSSSSSGFGANGSVHPGESGSNIHVKYRDNLPQGLIQTNSARLRGEDFK